MQKSVSTVVLLIYAFKLAEIPPHASLKTFLQGIGGRFFKIDSFPFGVFSLRNFKDNGNAPTVCLKVSTVGTLSTVLLCS